MRLLAATLALSLALSGVSLAKTYRVKAGEGAQAKFVSALELAKRGDRIRLGKGRFELNQGLTLGEGVRLEGAGADATVLSFFGQQDGQPGLRLGGENRLGRFTIENAFNGAVYAEDRTGLAFRSMAVRYTEPSRLVTADGFALVRARDVLFDTVNVTDAPDAGIYLSQTANVVVRFTAADENGVGLVLADSTGVDVYESSFSNNGLGLAIVDLAQTEGEAASIRVFRNQIVRNDQRVRASSLLGTGVPPAVGVLALAAHDVHLFENTIADHGGASVVILSTGAPSVDPSHIPVTHNLVVRNNVLGRAGYAPQGTLMTLRDRGFVIPDILWDGVESYGEGDGKRTLPVRILITNNLKQNNEPFVFTNLGIGHAGRSLEEAKPSDRLPEQGASVPEPAPVTLPNL